MTRRDYDCIVVGARCAGAPLATHLSRGGMKVLVLDSDALPGDQSFSTHAIQPTGMALLDELGIGDAIREVTPRVHRTRLRVGGETADVDLAPGREMYCPRRRTLDPLLQENARQAGAEIRDETTVLDVLAARPLGRPSPLRRRHAPGRRRGKRARQTTRAARQSRGARVGTVSACKALAQEGYATRPRTRRTQPGEIA